MDESPDYLPFKYRPQINRSDHFEAVNQRVQTAEENYRSNIELMNYYAETHASKTANADNQIMTLISEATRCENIRTELTRLWQEETELNEQISKQLWLKRERFLKLMKIEEENNIAQDLVESSSNFENNFKFRVKIRLKNETPDGRNIDKSWRMRR